MNSEIVGKSDNEREKISAVVISYNRVNLIGTCLRALSFADEVIVVDKSSTDGTAELAATLADRVISVPWSPVVEETRAFAVNECQYDWILLLDDDECLSVEAVKFIDEELRSPRADVYALPLKHYIIGLHDDRAYYWPEFHSRLFRKNSVSLANVVHSGVQVVSEAMYQIPYENGICIHHLSHASVEQWIEKANRYTSLPNRVRMDDGSYDIAAFARSRIDAFVNATRSDDRGAYPVAVAVLRSTYDIIDRLKVWESDNGVVGLDEFARICRELDDRYAAELPHRVHRAINTENIEPVVQRSEPILPASSDLKASVDGLRESVQLVRRLYETSKRQGEEALAREQEQAQAERARHAAQLAEERARSHAIIEDERARHQKALEDEHAKLNAILESERARQQDEATKALALAFNERVKLEQKLDATKATLTRVLAERVKRISEIGAEVRNMELRALVAESNHAHEASARLNAEAQLRAVTTSEFWRATAPLRSTVERSRKVLGLQKERANLLLNATVRGDIHSRTVLRASLDRRLGRKSSVPRPLEVPVPSASVAVAAAPALSYTPHEASVSSYGEWKRRFDTPDVNALNAMKASAGDVPAAAFIVRFSAASIVFAGRTISALKETIGLDWNAHFVFEPACDATAVQNARASVAQDHRFSLDAALRPDTRFAIFLEAGALPCTYGARLLAQSLLESASAVIAYSDEDMSTESGYADPWFKPQFSALLIKQRMLLGRMIAIDLTGELANELMPALLDASTDITALISEVALKAGEQRVTHVPHVLFHNLQPLSAPKLLPLPELTDIPVASVLIPTRDGWHLLGPCLESLKTTDWPKDKLEIIVIDNGSTDAETLHGMDVAEREGRIRILRDPRPFNYAQLNNDAARASRGELLVLLNNDTEIADPSWLRQLAAYAMLPEVGAVGPKLLYGDGTVQHAGVVLGIQGLAAHAHLFLGAREGGYQGLANATHEVSAVTGACLAVKRTAFEEVGGLNEQFRVAFNDVVFCLDLLDTGRKNIYLAEPLVVHHESKTRGYDDKPEKVRLLRKEARLAWGLHFKRLRNDIYYSPNLSFETPYKLAFAPRRRAAWNSGHRHPLKTMMLSSTHARGHGVAVVIDLQAQALIEQGHHVIIAGAASANDFDYPGCEKIVVHDPRSVASIAAEKGVDVIVAHTPPFFDVARWTGSYPPVIAYDYGEPPPEYFPDGPARQEGLDSKDLSLRASYKVLAISESVAAESTVPPHGVIPLGNGHLGRWTDALNERRAKVRKERNWVDSFVIMNVCRFHQGERFYKGVDEYAELRNVLEVIDPVLASRTVFVLCGKGDADDVAQMRARGLTVCANVTDAEMADLYAAADLYANFSRWEGYNLGIGQALAMGLPVIASDIPAHRAFGVHIAKDAAEAALHVVSESERTTGKRVPRIWEWDAPLAAFVAEIEAVAAR